MNNTLIKYIEKIRISRNLTREKFVEEILSERQYRRYLKGESSMPNEKVNKLITRLGIDLFDFYLDFIEESEIQTQRLKTLFNTIRTSQYAEAQLLLKDISENDLDSPYQKQYYAFCKIFLSIASKRTPDSVGYEEILILIDYPNILMKDHINFIELVALETTCNYLRKNKKDDRAIEFLNSILTNDNYEFKGINFMILPSIYANIARSYLIRELFESAIILLDKGIAICEKYEIYNSLANLLYYKAYYFKKSNDIASMQKTVKKLKALLIVEDNKKKTEYYLASLKNNL